MGAWGTEVQAAVQQMLDEDFNCSALIQHERESERVLAKTENESQLVLSHPNVVKALFDKRAAALEMLSMKKSQGLSMGPYVAVNYGRSQLANEGLGDVSGGLTMSYTPPGVQGKAALAARESLLRKKKIEEQKARLEIQAQLLELRQQIQRKVSLVNVFHDSLKTSQELMQTLETQRALGFVNSLNYANAYSGHVRTTTSYLDMTADLKKTIFRLMILHELAQQGASALGEAP